MRFPLVLCLALGTLVGCDQPTAPLPDEGYGLPVLHLEIEPDQLAWLTANVHGRRHVGAQLRYNGTRRPVEVRYQGNYSRTAFKKSYRLRSLDGALPGGFLRLNLSAQFSDPSMLNSRLGFDLFEAAGFPVPHLEWISLYLNGDYQGLYLMIEPIDAEFMLRRGYEEGNLYEGTTTADLSFNNGLSDVRDGLEKQWGPEDNYTDIEHLIHLLDTTPADLLPARLEPVLDVRRYLDYVAVSVILDNRDAFFKNYFLYHNPATDRFDILPWDLDITLNRSDLTFPFGMNHLSQRLMEVPGYRSYYLDRVHSLVETRFTESWLRQSVEAYRTRIAAAYEADPYYRAKGFTLDARIERLLDIALTRRTHLLDLGQPAP